MSRAYNSDGDLIDVNQMIPIRKEFNISQLKEKMIDNKLEIKITAIENYFMAALGYVRKKDTQSIYDQKRLNDLIYVLEKIPHNTLMIMFLNNYNTTQSYSDISKIVFSQMKKSIKGLYHV